MVSTIKNLATGEAVPDGMLPVPQELRRLGVNTDLSLPRLNRSRIAVTGKPGSGKSSLVGSNPSAILIDLEGSWDTLPDRKAAPFRLKPDSTNPVKDIESFVAELVRLKRAGKIEHETIIFDTLDELFELYSRDLRAQNNLEDVGDYKGGHGKGYFVIRDRMFKMLDDLWHAGFGWAAVCHVTYKDVEGVTVPSLVLSATFRNALFRKCEHFLELMFVPPEPGEITLASGKTVKVAPPKNAPMKRAISVMPAGVAIKMGYDNPKTRLPLPDRIEIPEAGGWDALGIEFDKAVQLRCGQGVAA